MKQWPLDGGWGYDGELYRRATHVFGAWVVGLPMLGLIRLLFPVEVRGREVVERIRPPVLLVSNHQSLIDSYFVCLLLGLYPHGLLQPRLMPFHTPEEHNFMAGPLGRALHVALRCVPVHRGAGLHQAGLEQVIELLRRGNLAYMFPEGTRTRDGRIGRAMPGVGRVVNGSGCSVLPVRIWGMDGVLPVGARLPRPGKPVRIRAGELMSPAAFADLPDTPRGWHDAADRLLEAIRALDWQD
jgi:1-acyl-sn-glycerol-3-phosphate acyltransferase